MVVAIAPSCSRCLTRKRLQRIPLGACESVRPPIRTCVLHASATPPGVPLPNGRQAQDPYPYPSPRGRRHLRSRLGDLAHPLRPRDALAGFRALLLQAVHPLVMAGFDANSGFRDDPWGRLQRTGEWIDTVTFGSVEDALRAGRRLRRLHASLRSGVEPESGLPFRVDDPRLLLWVHCTEVESFLSTYRRSGGRLSEVEGDRYVAEMVASAELLGLDPIVVPTSVQGVKDYYERTYPELRVTATARRNVFWSFAPPMPRWVQLATPARPAWASMIGLAASMLPPWARRLYGLPGLPTTDLAASVTGRAVRGLLLAAPASLTRGSAHTAALERLGA